MARQISERNETGVRLLTLELSEDELAVFTACLNHVLDHFDDQTLERVCGAYRDEVEGMRDDLAQLLDVPVPDPLGTQATQPASVG